MHILIEPGCSKMQDQISSDEKVYIPPVGYRIIGTKNIVSVCSNSLRNLSSGSNNTVTGMNSGNNLTTESNCVLIGNDIKIQPGVDGQLIIGWLDLNQLVDRVNQLELAQSKRSD